MRRRALPFCFRSLLFLTLVVAGVLAYLSFFGFPDWARERWVRHMAKQGIHLDASSIVFNPWEGLRAQDFRYYDSGLRVVPVLEAERVNLDLDTAELIRGKAGLRGLHIHGGTVRVSPQGVLHQADPDKVLVIEELDADLRISPVEILVQSLFARILHMQVKGAGTILLRLPGTESEVRLSPLVNSPTGLRPDWLGPVAAQLNAITFTETPQLDVEFVVKLPDMAASELSLHGVGGATTARGVAFDGWEMKGAYRNRQATVTRLNAYLGEQEMSASGTYVLDGGLLETHVRSSLPPHHWRSLMPIDWRDRLEAMRLFFRGAVDWDLTLGPAPVASIWGKTSGTLRLAQAELSDIWFEEAELQFSTTTNRLELRDIRATLGQGANQGTVQGKFSWDLDQNQVQGEADAQIDCIALMPIMTTNLIKVVQRLQFPEESPRSVVTFSGRIGDASAFVLNGNIAGTNVFYRGSHVDIASVGISVTNRVLTLDPLIAIREEGRVDGLVRVDFSDKRIDLDLVTTVDPKAAARAATPKLEQIFRVFEFNGPTHTEVVGQIYIRDKEKTSLQASSVTEGLVLKSFHSDRATLDVNWTGDHVVVSNIHAQIYEGEIDATYEVFGEPGGERPRYVVKGRASGVNFEDVARTWLHKEGEPYSGKIGGTLQLSGLLGQGQGRHAKGAGTAHITRGQIMRIPLFGGLSRMLSRIYPGLGFFKQTDFTSTFDIDGYKIAMSEVGLEGAVFSLKGQGDYFLDTKVVDYDVEFQLLREGLVSTVVRFVTLPITKLLTFDLEGTLDQPVWRPKNLPRELFEGFDQGDTEQPQAAGKTNE